MFYRGKKENKCCSNLIEVTVRNRKNNLISHQVILKYVNIISHQKIQIFRKNEFVSKLLLGRATFILDLPTAIRPLEGRIQKLFGM